MCRNSGWLCTLTEPRSHLARHPAAAEDPESWVACKTAVARVGRDQQLPHGWRASKCRALEAGGCETGPGAVRQWETVCCCRTGMLGKVALF